MNMNHNSICMKPIHRSFRSLLLLAPLALAGLTASCGDDDHGMDVPTVPEEFVVPDSLERDALAFEIITKLCEVDSSNIYHYRYTPRFGRADEADPSVLYLKSMDDGDAVSFFEYLVPTSEKEQIVRGEGVLTYSIEGEGTLTCTTVGSADVQARIDVNLEDLPDVRQLVYIPESMWPYNDKSTPFKIGSVWNRKESNHTWRYVCVKEYCGDNDKGIMMTFDGGWGTEEVDDCTVLVSSSEWTWKKLEDLYKKNRTKYNNARNQGAIPENVERGSPYAVGGHEKKTKWYWPYTEHTIRWTHFSGGSLVFESFEWKSPWKKLVTYCNLRGSSSVEFGDSRPSGTWSLVSM